jgi:nucleotide-binding universal stress UspA family protein
MWKKILIANDGSENAIKGIDVGLRLAKKFNAEVHIIYIEEELPHYAAAIREVEESKREINRYFQRINEEIMDMAKSIRVKPEIHVVQGHAVEKVIKFAIYGKFDLLVIGFMGHSRIFGKVMGSTAQNIIRLSPCSILVVKEEK